MHRSTVRALSAFHAAVFSATRGHLGRRLVDNDMLLLTTIGRHSGRRRTSPLLYLTEGDSFHIAASFGGRPHHPDWYLNLVANPRAMVRIGPATTPVVATTLATGARDVWWQRFVAAYDGFERYQAKTDRIIPVVRLDPIAAAGTTRSGNGGDLL